MQARFTTHLLVLLSIFTSCHHTTDERFLPQHRWKGQFWCEQYPNGRTLTPLLILSFVVWKSQKSQIGPWGKGPAPMGTHSNARVRPLRRRNFLIAKGTMNTIRSVERRDRLPGRGREWRSRQGSAEIPRRKRCSVTRSALGGEPVEHIQHNIAEDMSHMTKSGIAILCLPYVRPGASSPKPMMHFPPFRFTPLFENTFGSLWIFFPINLFKNDSAFYPPKFPMTFS